MSSNKDFSPSSSPIPFTCAIEIEAILFLFMMNCYKSTFQECITIIVWKIESTRNQPPYQVYFSYKKKGAFRLPRSGCLGTPFTLPQSLYGRTDGWTYADVRTKIFRIKGVTKFAYPWCSASSAKNYKGYNYREQFNCDRMPVVNARKIWTTIKANQLL